MAMSASALCLVHCLLLPVAIAFLPALAAWTDSGEVFHLVMLAIALPLSGGTLLLGWRRHGSIGPLILGVPGLVLLMLGLAFEGRVLGTALTVAGGVALAIAHVRNLRATNLARLAAR